MKQETDAQDIEKGRQPLVAAAESESRRRLIRGGLIGAPIILTLKSTPVLACNCKLPSGFSTSGNLSRNQGNTCKDPARGPDFWKTATRNVYINGTWKWEFGRTGLFTDTPFKDVFGGTDQQTLLTVLSKGIDFQSLVVAAILGIKSRYFVSGPGISERAIKKMWNKNYIPPGGSKSWTQTESENYLRYVMGLPLLAI